MPTGKLLLVGRLCAIEAGVQGAELLFASMAAGGQLLQCAGGKGSDDSALAVCGRKADRAHRWRYDGAVLVCCEGGQPVPADVHALNVYAANEVRAFVRDTERAAAELTQQVRCQTLVALTLCLPAQVRADVASTVSKAAQ